MIGGLTKTTSRFAVAAAAGMFMGGMALTPAQAADLGGDCCADLEERVAELEATTVRKGNRKVSLKISGQVNRSLLIWDDGDESDIYSVDNNASGTRVRLTGSATIRPGWSAGYYIEWQMQTATTSAVNQFNAAAGGGDDAGSGFTLRHAVWYVKSDKLGKLWVGQHSMATDNLIYMILGGSSIAQGGFDVGLVGGGFRLARSNVSGNPGHQFGTISALVGTETWGRYLPSFDAGNRDDIVRYDSPDILGCVISAAWGDDDDWDVAARCKKELNSVKILLGIGYIEHTSGETEVTAFFSPTAGGGTTLASVNGIHGNNDFIVSGSILHDPTGLFIHGTYTEREFDCATTLVGAIQLPGIVRNANCGLEDSEHFYIQAGISRRWNDLGKTIIYGDWRHADDANVGAIGTNFDGNNATVSDSEADAYGFGVVQKVDNAAMEFYFDYKHFEADVQTCNGIVGGGCTTFTNQQIDDFDRVNVGARIKF